MRSLIWRAMVRKACSTLLAFLADVSRNGMPRLSANSCSRSQSCVDLSRAFMLATCLCHGVLDDLLVRHVTLVAHQQLVHSLRGVAVDLLQPLLDVVEAVHVGDIVDDADAVGAAVVGGCDGAEALLAGGVPLQPQSAYCKQQNEYLIRSATSRSCHRVRSFGFSMMMSALVSHSCSPTKEHIRSPPRLSRCSSPCRCRPQTARASKTFRRPSLRSGAA